jgi:hypothetical protein
MALAFECQRHGWTKMTDDALRQLGTDRRPRAHLLCAQTLKRLCASAAIVVVVATGCTNTAGPSGSPTMGPYQMELAALVGPIALYPDALIAVTLPASTEPMQVVEAQRFLDARKTDNSLQPSNSWDPAVVSLLNYPSIIQQLNANVDWTRKLGDAVVRDQKGVMEAIQLFRQRAYQAGTLKSNDKVDVEAQDAADGSGSTIVINSTNPDAIYIPRYNPTTVVVHKSGPVIAYSDPYPYYYYNDAAFYTGAFFGAAMAYGIAWNTWGIYNWPPPGPGPHFDPGPGPDPGPHRGPRPGPNPNVRPGYQGGGEQWHPETAWRPSHDAIERANGRLRAGGRREGGGNMFAGNDLGSRAGEFQRRGNASMGRTGAYPSGRFHGGVSGFRRR